MKERKILKYFTDDLWFKQHTKFNSRYEWWAICHLHHRWSDKDMKTKGQCSGFKNENGKYIFKPY